MAETLNETIEKLRTYQEAAYTKLEEKGATIPENKTTANLADTIDSISIIDISGFKYADDTSVESVLDIFSSKYRGSIVSITDSSKEIIPRVYFSGLSTIKYLNLPGVIALKGNSGNDNYWAFQNCNALINIELPNCLYFYGDRIFDGLGNSTLRRINIHNWIGLKSSGTDIPNAPNQIWYSCPPNLIDLEVGANFTTSCSKFASGYCYWNPTNAIKTDDDSLVIDTVDEFGNAIDCNAKLLLYNIRRHIAALLPTTDSGLSFYFHTNIKDLMNNEENSVTIKSFTDKGWTIA